jgi:hypothetical protein
MAASSGNSGTGTSSTLLTTYPTGVAAGDIVMISTHYNANTITVTTIEQADVDDPGAWTAVAGITFPVDQSTNSRIGGAWWRRLTQADIDDDTAPTITYSGAITGGWTALAFRGVLRDAVVTGQVNTAVASATSVTLGALTGVTVGSALVAFAHGRVATGTAALTGWTPDADYTEPANADHGTNRTSGSNPNVRMTAAYRLGVAQGNYSGDSFAPNATASLGSIVVELLAEPTPSTTVIQDPAVAPVVELRTGAGDSWTPANVRYGGPGGRAVIINHGRANEQSSFAPSQCTVRFDNRTGNYSPRNPLSSNYGKLGRNTPIRVLRRIADDDFSSAGTNGFPTSDTGHAWTVLGAVAPYSVAGGLATMAMDTTGKEYAAMLGGVSLRSGLVRVTMAPTELAVGASIQMAVMAQWHNTGNYYYGVLVFQTNGTVDLAIVEQVDGVIEQISAIGDSIPYTASSSFYVEMGYSRGALQLTIWDTADYTSTISVTGLADGAAGDVRDGGMVGVRASLAASNTNAPISVTFNDFRLDSVRFIGQVPSWVPVWETTGTDATVTVRAEGAFARLAVGRRTTGSAPRRYLEDRAADSSDGLVAAWPLEDGALVSAAAPLVGNYSLQPFAGAHTSGAVVTHPEFGSGQLAPWLPSVLSWSRRDGLAIMYAAVQMLDFTDEEYTIEFAVAISRDSALLEIDVNPSYLDGAAGWPRLKLEPLTREVTVSMNGEADSSTTVEGLFDGKVHYVRWSVEQSGTDGAWAVEVDGVLEEFGGTSGAMTLEAPRYIAVVSDPTGTEGGSIALGYLSVWHGEPTFNPALSEGAALGYYGETAFERLDRLCDELGFVFAAYDSDDTTELMGHQDMHTMPALIEDCENVDRGLLVDPMTVYPAIGYRARNSMQNQGYALDLDYTEHELSAVPTVVDDLALAANDVTVARAGGTARRYVVTSGSLSTAEPPEGIGTYERPLTIAAAGEDQAGRVAEWTAALGTVDAPRLPSVPVALHRSAYADVAKTLINDTLDALIGDRARVRNLPTAFLPPTDHTGLIYGWTESFDQFEHYFDFNLVPDEVWSNIGIWEDEETRWDSDASSAQFDFAAGTDTALAVLVEADKSRWLLTSEDATQFPLYVSAAGVDLEVTAIAGYFETDFDYAATAQWSNGWTTHAGDAADYNVTATGDGDATIDIDAVNSSRRTLRPVTSLLTDIDHVMSFSTAVLATGGSIVGSMTARVDPADIGNTYYYAEVALTTSATVTARLVRRLSAVETTLAAAVTVSGLTHVINTKIWVRMVVAGDVIRMAVGSSRAAVVDTPTWVRVATDTGITAAGRHGLRSVLSTGNSNALPVVMSYGDYEVLNPQGFTVTQAPVNGIEKTIAAGEKVSLTNAARWGW